MRGGSEPSGTRDTVTTAPWSTCILLSACVLWACSDADIASDAGLGDAGTGIDSGSSDAGAGDAGGVDAGGTDAAMADAGGIDAALADAGTDAGMEPDAGPSTTPTAGALVISEIMADSDVVTDDCGEWFELHNPSATVTYNLRGCVIADMSNNFAVTTDVLIPPGAFFALSRYESTYCAGMLGISGPGFTPDYHYLNVKFANEGDFVRLTCGGAVVDQVSYVGWSVTKGASFNLDPGNYDAVANDAAAAWCSASMVYNMAGSEHDRGTPGMPNSDC